MLVEKGKLSEEKIEAIAEAFSDYVYEEGEKGLFYLCDGTEAVRTYMRGFVKGFSKVKTLYTTSERGEGYIMLTEPDTKIRFADLGGIFDFLSGCIKGLGWRGAVQFVKAIKNAGESLESKLKKQGKEFIQIEMVAVLKEYQNQGYMRKLLNIAIEKADARGIPCIVSTDGKLKAEKYKHLGFELYGIRKYTEGSFEYDLIRFPAGSEGEKV